MLIWKNKNKSINWQGYTVILPSISVGNLGQLGCDLLISTLNIERVGSIFHKALIPIYGPSAFDYNENNFISACDVYADEDSKLVIVQIRSPIIEHYLNDFHTDLLETLKGCSKVILLTSSFDYEKKIQVPLYAYKASEDLKEKYASQLANIGWPEFNNETIYGGGTSLRLYTTFNAAKIPVFLFFKYIEEGDNCQDAIELIKELNKLFESDLKIGNGDLKLKSPISWRLLFGNEAKALVF